MLQIQYNFFYFDYYRYQIQMMISLLNEFYYECAMNPVNLIKFFINSDEEITKQKDESEGNNIFSLFNQIMIL